MYPDKERGLDASQKDGSTSASLRLCSRPGTNENDVEVSLVFSLYEDLRRLPFVVAVASERSRRRKR